MSEEEIYSFLGWTKEQAQKSKDMGSLIAERMIYGEMPYSAMVKEVSEMEEFPVSMRCHLCVTIHKTVTDIESSPELVTLITLRNLLKDMKKVSADGKEEGTDH